MADPLDTIITERIWTYSERQYRLSDYLEPGMERSVDAVVKEYRDGWPDDVDRYTLIEQIAEDDIVKFTVNDEVIYERKEGNGDLQDSDRS